LAASAELTILALHSRLLGGQGHPRRSMETASRGTSAVERLQRPSGRFVRGRDMSHLTTTSVAIDGSKFKAVNNRDKNFTRAKVQRRRAQLEESPRDI
jgi:hypothetical protein